MRSDAVHRTKGIAWRTFVSQTSSYITSLYPFIGCLPSALHVSLSAYQAIRHYFATMAEPMGSALAIATIAAEQIALAIPGLFLNCVELFSLVRLSYEFTNDFGSLNLQLRAIEIRLQRWGNAAGITDERSETFIRHFEKSYSSDEIRLAYNACDQIKRQLQRATKNSPISAMSSDSAELKVMEESQQLKTSEPDVKHAHDALSKLKIHYQSPLKPTTKVGIRGKWTLYKKTQFEELLRVIAEHVTLLEKFFPLQERVLAAQEAKALEPEAVKALVDIATTSDPILGGALRAEASRRGFSLGINAKAGKVTAEFGNVKSDENARLYSGGKYILSSAQFARGTKDAGLVATMDDDDWPLGRSRNFPEIQSSYGRRSRDPSARPEEQFYFRSGPDQLPMRQNDQIVAPHEAKHGTKSSLHQLEPSQSLADLTDVSDDGRRSPQGSFTVPETYSTNSRPFRGSTGFSSVGDASTRELSSATGLETHDLPERESRGIERNCSEDEHISDTMSIHTDGREHNLDPDTSLSLAEAFAGHIVENLTPQQLNDLFDQQDAIESIAELIGDFSVLLGMSIANDDAQSRAVTFVRHQRTEIAKGLASAAKAWRPSTKDQVSMEEKFKMLHFGDTEPTQCDDPNLEQVSTSSHQDEDQPDSLYAVNDTPELRDVVLGRNFVLGSEELPWMIDSIRRYESLLHTGKIFSSVRSGIARAIELHSEHVEFSLNWDILEILNQQYDGESRSQIRLSDMIVYNGTPSLCYASTTSEYVKQIWPALGAAVVECFDRALLSADGTSTLALQDSRLDVKLDGVTTKVCLDTTTEKSTSQSRIHMLEVRLKTSTDTK